MRGGIQKKGNNYYAVVYDGIDSGTGRKRRTWIPAGTRRNDAEKVLAEEIKRRHDGVPVPTEKLTLGQYLTDRWLPIQKSRVRASTYDSYRRNIDLHVLPALGRRPIERLTPDDLDVFYATLLTEGRKTPKASKPTRVVGECDAVGPAGLAPKTVRNIHLMLNKAMNDAQRKGIVVRNVVALADAPTLKNRQEGNIKAWDARQLRTFLDSVRSHRLHPAFHLSSHTGMRRGEVLGLRWCDVDLENMRLSVRQALVSIAYEVEISDVKTGTGRRTIDLDPVTIDVLKAWRIQRAEEKGGIDPKGDELVFVKPDGSWIHPHSFSQVLDRKVAKLDVPTISLHDLRHTHATLLLKAGVPVKVVSERLGHANVAFTMAVYQHVLPGMQAAAASTFAQLLGNPGIDWSGWVTDVAEPCPGPQATEDSATNVVESEGEQL
ncbi:site-specific integrase [Iamia sp. SCSIO 61187]|uniref:tyrosine-type recombinase/integrase n=1 Tax=Iamia sp. SCSIO 61187 TaxID=2722752 RepID=UPI001C629920|nr:site-specific integrase [Iamia sp. SCSIO 61187]QYG91762.1 site-specific integrase [Iamia sp. SCSIO 61187]